MRPPQDEELSWCHQRLTSCWGAPLGASRSTHSRNAAGFIASLGGMPATIEVEAEIAFAGKPCGEPAHRGRHLGIAAHPPGKGIVIGH